MQVSELAHAEGFAPAVLADDRAIASVYCADLLSWAMSRAPENCAWCTIMGNINAVAVASLADVATIVLCEDAVLDEDAAEKARQQGVNIVRTALPAFQAGLVIHMLAGFGQ